MSRVSKAGNRRHETALICLVSMHAPSRHQLEGLVVGGQCVGYPLAARRSAQPKVAVAQAMEQGASLRLSNRVVMRSAVWRFVEALGGEYVALLVFVCMARILAPESFGLIALAGVLISGGQVTLQGIAEAVVQGKELANRQFMTAFWCNLGLGALLMLVMGAMARPLAMLFGDLLRGPAGDCNKSDALALSPRQSMCRAHQVAQAVERRIWQWSFVRCGCAAATALALRSRLGNL